MLVCCQPCWFICLFFPFPVASARQLSFPTRNALSIAATTGIAYFFPTCGWAPSNPIPFLKFNLLACFRLPFSSLVCFVAVRMSVCLCVLDSLLWRLICCLLVLSYQAVMVLLRRSFYSGLGAAVKIFPSGCFYGHFSSYVSATVFKTELSAVDPALPTIKPWLIYNVFLVFV